MEQVGGRRSLRIAETPVVDPVVVAFVVDLIREDPTVDPVLGPVFRLVPARGTGTADVLADLVRSQSSWAPFLEVQVDTWTGRVCSVDARGDPDGRHRVGEGNLFRGRKGSSDGLRCDRKGTIRWIRAEAVLAERLVPWECHEDWSGDPGLA